MNIENYDIDKEFTSDDDVEEMLNNIITTVGEAVSIDNNKNSIVDIIKIQHVLYTYKTMKYLTAKNKDIKVKYELHKPYTSMGYVTLTGKNISFRKPEWFMKAVELASSFEVYPKTDGTVEMNFTFHGLTKPLE